MQQLEVGLNNLIFAVAHNCHSKTNFTHSKTKLTHGKTKLTHSKTKSTHGKTKKTSWSAVVLCIWNGMSCNSKQTKWQPLLLRIVVGWKRADDNLKRVYIYSFLVSTSGTSDWQVCEDSQWNKRTTFVFHQIVVYMTYHFRLKQQPLTNCWPTRFLCFAMTVVGHCRSW